MPKFGFFKILAATLFLALQAPLAFNINSQPFIRNLPSEHKKITAKKNKALIYKGEGSCIEDCSESAAMIAKMAGLEPIYVSPTESNLDLFADAAVWIQPGGESLVVAAQMSVDLKNAIRNFVQQGGGYVGFCAGAFFADLWIHGTESKGLGIIPAYAIDYQKARSSAEMLDMIWNGKKRSVYWEEGPYLELFFKGQLFTPFAYYPTGEIASIYGNYYQGRVSVTGTHPEAPQYWRDDIKASDPDGLDYDLAIDMVRWAAGLKKTFAPELYSSELN